MSGLLQVLLRKLRRLNTPVWFLPSGFICSNIEMLNLGSIDILDQLIFCYERRCCAVWGAEQRPGPLTTAASVRHTV